MQDEDRILAFQEQVEAAAKEMEALEGVNKDESIIKVEEEVKETQTTNENTRVFTDIEKEQMELGWDPNKTGPTAVSAEEFKRVGQIIEAKRAASKRAEVANKEVLELTKTVKQLVDHNRKLEKASYEKALTDLKAERNEKISIGDVEGVNELNLKEKVLEKAKESIMEEPVQQASEQPLSAEALAYSERNKFWLHGNSQEDRKMQILTQKVIEYMQATSPEISEPDAIKTIEKEIRDKFPHRFDNPNQEKAPVVMQSTSTPTSNKVSSMSSLSREERDSFMSIQKVDPTYTLKEFTEQLELIGRRS